MPYRALFVLLLSIAVLACAPQEPTPAKVTYIANEGFLIEAGGSKVLIDAIFNDETINYAHVPDRETLAALEEAAAPFNDIDLILVTHSHRDHFAPEPVLSHLAANPEALLLAPTQAVEMLRAGPDDRVVEINLDLHQSTEMDFGNIRIEAHRLRHSPYMIQDPRTGERYNRHEGVENIAYWIEVGGFTLFHIGDAVLSGNLDYLATDRFPSRRLDIAFVEFFDLSEETGELLTGRLPTDRIIFMHLPREQERIELLTTKLQAEFSNGVIFQQPGESREFPPPQ
jgi:L-ascorbate metabolism protein UlaG (beta-lactamase superfamily)